MFIHPRSPLAVLNGFEIIGPKGTTLYVNRERFIFLKRG